MLTARSSTIVTSTVVVVGHDRATWSGRAVDSIRDPGRLRLDMIMMFMVHMMIVVHLSSGSIMSIDTDKLPNLSSYTGLTATTKPVSCSYDKLSCSDLQVRSESSQ